MVCMWANLLMDCVQTNPQGLELHMLAFVFMGFIPLQDQVTNTEVIIPCRLLIEPSLDTVLVDCKFFFFFHPFFLKLVECIHPTVN